MEKITNIEWTILNGDYKSDEESYEKQYSKILQNEWKEFLILKFSLAFFTSLLLLGVFAMVSKI